MRRRLLSRLAVAGCALSVVLTPTIADARGGGHDGHGGRDSASYKRVGYFTQWGVYGRDFQVNDLVTSGTAAKLTHLNYAFGNINADGKCFLEPVPGEGDPWADYQRPMDAENSVDGVADTAEQKLAGNFNQLRELKRKYPKLKVLISLGGWSWSTNFSNAVATPEKRKALVASCVDLYIKGNLPLLDGKGGKGSAKGLFDGIDIDWEWPNWPGDADTVYRPEDKQNFTAMLAEFRKQLNVEGARQHKHYQLSAFLPANAAAIDAGIEARKVFELLDFGNLQGYDLHGPWEKTTNQQSAIHSPDDSLEQVVNDWRRRGAPASKIVVGVPFYGHGWTGVTGGGDGYQQPAAAAAPATWEAGSEDYKVLKQRLAAGEFTLYRDDANGHAWLFDGNTFWTYDDPKVVTAKTKFIKDLKLGGAMIWSLDGDTADGELINALDSGLK
ncbi:Chitinase 63 [Streptomyces sp. RB5]|uniref:chitinase n=1 Tax=Streptomyces smaragdinus TaxID=2585196 RepID=A0A7K0CKL2_9ACTN|nr:glycoside hydrolase family 18 protein [Streptomyces smaragdinus]MQY13532.1 Chitinase 63 [Streptomyces smaragdinus]